MEIISQAVLRKFGIKPICSDQTLTKVKNAYQVYSTINNAQLKENLKNLNVFKVSPFKKLFEVKDIDMEKVLTEFFGKRKKITTSDSKRCVKEILEENGIDKNAQKVATAPTTTTQKLTICSNWKPNKSQFDTNIETICDYITAEFIAMRHKCNSLSVI